MPDSSDELASTPEPNWLRLQDRFPHEVRDRAIQRAAYRCQGCHAEQGRVVIRSFLAWPDPRVPWVAAHRPDDWPWDGCRETVRLFLVAPSSPWSGDESVLDVLCFPCVIHREVQRATGRR